MTHSNPDETSPFLKRIAKEGPQVKEDFVRAHANEKRERTAPQFGSKQVEDTRPEPFFPPPSPGLGHAGASATHSQAAAVDRTKTREQHRQATKEAFLKRAAHNRSTLTPNRGRE